MNSTLSNFIKRTHCKSGINSNKDLLRKDLVDYVINSFNSKDHISILTLPSAFWNFEKILAKKLKSINNSFFFHTTACERDRKIFEVSLLKIPRVRNQNIKYYYNKDYECDVINSFGIAKIHCIDVFEYLLKSDHTFDFIWLDLISPLKTFEDKIYLLDKSTNKASIVCLTFLKARDDYSYVGKRFSIVNKIMSSMGFNCVSNQEYFDTSPMLHLIFKKIQS